MNDISIREASLADWDAIIALTGLWEDENISYGVRRDTPEDLEGCKIWVAERGKEMLGFVSGRLDAASRQRSIMPDGEEYFEIEELYVRPEERSGGLGGRLFACAEEYARACGCRHIMLSTSTRDTMAMLRFYQQRQQMQVWSMRLFKEI